MIENTLFLSAKLIYAYTVSFEIGICFISYI